MSFDPSFRFYSDGREPGQLVDLPDTWWAALAVELRDELASRLRLYPGRVAKGRMSRADADKELRAWRGVIRDCVGPAPASGEDVASWTDQAHALRREIALRRRFYPQWVLAGRIDGAEADHKLQLLEQWHDLLWHHCRRPEAVAARADTARRAAEREARAAA